MSVIVAGGATALYAVTVVGLYRWYVWRQRAAAGGFPTLTRIDWEALIAGLLPPGEAGLADDVPPLLPDGQPTPPSLRRATAPDARARRGILLELLGGARLDEEDPRLSEAGFSGGERRWISALSVVRGAPELALERLELAEPGSAAELYLREYLRLSCRTHVANRELQVFACKRRIAAGLERFGDVPCLYFVRARASAMVGMNRAAIDDLARAVYFSRTADFYLNAVLDSPYLEEARPPLVYQCRHTLDERRRAGERPGR